MKIITKFLPLSHFLFAATIFSSSFLLFQVQPLIGKHILPWYGGSSAVWVTALFFFMVALAVGYCYALLLSWFRTKIQVIIHAIFVTLVCGQVYIHTKQWPSGITPSPDQIFATSADPTWSVFLTLIISIGLPFVLLASTSSLLQLWYSRVSGREPFSLYSISNIGSLLGLLSYPILFEPLLKTQTQGLWWTFGLALYIGLLCSVLITTFQKSLADKDVAGTHSEKIKLAPRSFLIWVGVASVPVMVLLSGTIFMTTAVAPIPLLWVGPLALYLFSFIWTFRTRTQPHLAELNQSAVIVLGLLALVLFSLGAVPVLATVLVIHAAMLAVFHWCHEYLYALRPKTEQLALFYVALSLGGILGSIIIKVSSLYLLVIPIELTIILGVSLLSVTYMWYLKFPTFLPPHLKKFSRLYTLSFGIFVCVIGTYHVYLFQQRTSDHERNFFGYKAVNEYQYRGNLIKGLQHGLTSHGFQVMVAGVPQIEAASYYATSSGAGRVFEYMQTRKPEESLNVAIIGLGTGGLAAYCRPQDEYQFIEIDPQVERLARKHFTYLEFCPQAEVLIADGRLALEKQQANKPENKYDLILLDAYADDVVPIHLMTKEAIGLYKKSLKPDGMLAMNISSRYLDLLPVSAFLAEENNLTGRYLYDREPASPLASVSIWVMMAEQDSIFTQAAFKDVESFADIKKRVRWTDTYSALLPIIKIW